MKNSVKKIAVAAAISLLTLPMQACAVVGGIFKAGMVWGIVLVGLVVAAVILLITRSGKK